MSRPWRRLASLASRLGPLLAVAAVAAVALAACSQIRAAPPPPPSWSADQYIGAELCKACHEEPFKEFAATKMGRLFLNLPRTEQERRTCEGCHGPGKTHLESGGVTPMPVSFTKKGRESIAMRNAVCLGCHERTARLFWQGSPHEARDVACTNCHTLMRDVSPKSQLAKGTELETCGQCHIERRAQQLRTSHMPLVEGKMTCSSCHNPHGSVTPALLKENSINDTCYTCHAEKRGPFLWEHAPVVESCANCHDPHGTNNERMLRVGKPRLCQQCHIETRHPTRPYGTDAASAKFVLGRGCSSCHVNIHGSNHPSGFAFTR
jgi:DmsE family decaheme c-type cytochrome